MKRILSLVLAALMLLTCISAMASCSSEEPQTEAKTEEKTENKGGDVLLYAGIGVIALAAAREYFTIDDILQEAADRGEAPLIVICDELSDPHNLGAILRTAEAAGAHGVIVPRRRAAGLTSTVYKASAGAVEYVPVARVANITETLKDLKKRGIWVYGLDMDGDPWCRTDLTDAMALVVGSEGRGVSRLVKEQCDFVLSLPMAGQINSLNASVACGIVLYEAARQRQGIKAIQK